MVCTRPDIAHAVGVVSRFMSNPRRKNWEAIKWLLHYLRGTSKTTLCFSKNDVILEGYFDADLEGCSYTRKSTTRFVFIVGNCNKANKEKTMQQYHNPKIDKNNK